MISPPKNKFHIHQDSFKIIILREHWSLVPFC